jgi:N-acetyltransferase 10
MSFVILLDVCEMIQMIRQVVHGSSVSHHHPFHQFPFLTQPNWQSALHSSDILFVNMVRKRLDDRVRCLLENAVATHQRAMLVLVGDHGKDQVPVLHQILSKMSLNNPETLWCYKKTLGFSTHRMKRIKKIKRDKSRGLLNDDADAFELFLSHGSISWVFYKESHRVLGRTVDLLVLQDFEALTPNLLARTIETVRGGGLIIILLKTVESLQQLYSMTMDVHSRYRTESNSTIVPRFNERFILSLGRNKSCLVCDDELNVLPLSKKALLELQRIGKIPKGDGGEVIKHQVPVDQELVELKEKVADMPHIGALVDLAKTLDQAKAVLTFLDACTDKGGGVVTMTAARGRGKSAALGLCLAGAIAFGYSTIAVTSPEPENVNALFDFIVKGLKALRYQEQVDFDIVYNNATGRDQIKCITAIRLHRSHRQVIQYLDPQHKDKFSSAELVAIDEAAAIPLPTVRSLIQSDRLVFLSSTVNGYEGTGRALSLKLIQELRSSKGGRDAALSAAQAAAEAVGKRSQSTSKRDAAVHEQRYEAAATAATCMVSSKSLREIELEAPIRYAPGDGIENWLNRLLCLDSTSSWKLNGNAPAPADCELYSVDRDALFSYHKLSEAFLQKLMGLYTSAHYKNTPNDLQMLSDAPAHSLFVLLPPVSEIESSSLPDVLAVVQVALEGKVSRKAVEAQLARGHRSAGDLIPWTLSQQFGDAKFAQLSGARIVRIAVHPTVQGMGYGSRAMELLRRFYNGEMVSIVDTGMEEDADMEENNQEVADDSDEDGEELNGQGLLGERLKPKKELPPLLLPLTEVEAPQLDWIGTSFGLTLSLHKFWTRCGMKLLYLRQTKNDLTGEHSAILVRALPKRTGVDDSWLPAFVTDARRRLTMLLGGTFRDMEVKLAMSIFDEMQVEGTTSSERSITADELDFLITPYDRKRLELYGRNLCDHHLVTDLLPVLARLYFTGRFGKELTLSGVQAALLCGIGLQCKTVDSFVHELGLPINQVLAMFNKAVRKISIGLNGVVERREEEKLLQGDNRKKAESILQGMNSETAKTLDEDLADAAVEAHEKLNTLPPEVAGNPDLLRYVVKGSDKAWEKALDGRQIEGDVEDSTILITSRREISHKREAEQQEPSTKGTAKGTSSKRSMARKRRENKARQCNTV